MASVTELNTRIIVTTAWSPNDIHQNAAFVDLLVRLLHFNPRLEVGLKKSEQSNTHFL